jgi:hypothetical protein
VASKYFQHTFSILRPYFFFGISILFLFVVRIISFNNNVLNHDELEWLYGIHRTLIDPRPFVGFEGHTSGPTSTYFLSLLNLFIEQPLAIHLRLFSFFFLITPTLALVFWGKANHLNYAGLVFLTILLSVSFVPFEYKFEDLYCYNTEFQILLFTALLYTLLVSNLSNWRVILFAIILVLFLFVKIQGLILFAFFGLAMLLKLVIQRTYERLYLFLSVVSGLLISVLSYLWLTDTLNEAFYVYVEKNILYQSSVSGENIDWILVAKNMLSFYFKQFLFNTAALFFTVVTCIFLFYKRKAHVFRTLNFHISPIFLSACLLSVSMLTIVLSKNNYGHYFIISFFPMAMFFSETFYLAADKLEKKWRLSFIGAMLLLLLSGANVNYLTKSLKLLASPRNERKQYQLGFQRGFQLDSHLIDWLRTHRQPNENTILYIGWFTSATLYYELGHMYAPVYRSSNFFWYRRTYEQKNERFFQREEANLMEDLQKTPPFYIVDCEELVPHVTNTQLGQLIALKYFVVQSGPNFKIYQRKN